MTNIADTLVPSVSNVLAVYAQADADSLREGLSWYLDAHNFANILDPDNPRKAAGIIAALSPMNGWEPNKNAAAKVYAEGTAFGTHTVPNEVKADSILCGAEPLDVLKGDKVRAFFRTIAEPFGLIQPVIDRHAFDIAVGRVTDEKSRGILGRKGVYDLFASVYIDAAKVAGISSSQMQAVTWVAWRKIKANS